MTAQPAPRDAVEAMKLMQELCAKEASDAAERAWAMAERITDDAVMAGKWRTAYDACAALAISIRALPVPAPSGPAQATSGSEAPAPYSWEEIARQYAKNADYYRGLVVEIGQMFGAAAYIADDGGLHGDVLCAKVPDLVKAALAGSAEAEGQPR